MMYERIRTIVMIVTGLTSLVFFGLFIQTGELRMLSNAILYVVVPFILFYYKDDSKCISKTKKRFKETEKKIDIAKGDAEEFLGILVD